MHFPTSKDWKRKPPDLAYRPKDLEICFTSCRNMKYPSVCYFLNMVGRLHFDLPFKNICYPRAITSIRSWHEADMIEEKAIFRIIATQ